MTLDALEDGEICPFCGTPVFFHGEGAVDCPGCGAAFVNAEDDRADELRDDVDLEFDNDPDMLDDFDDGPDAQNDAD
ncbi:MAG: hypothetical protein ACKOAT_09205 [Actinomycetota bacterium]